MKSRCKWLYQPCKNSEWSSINAAAAQFNVSRSTFQRRVSGGKSQSQAAATRHKRGGEDFSCFLYFFRCGFWLCGPHGCCTLNSAYSTSRYFQISSNVNHLSTIHQQVILLLKSIHFLTANLLFYSFHSLIFTFTLTTNTPIRYVFVCN
jgi:hypothetical protein